MISAPGTFTWTFEYEPVAGHVLVERFVITEEDGGTTVTSTSTLTPRSAATG